MERKRVAMGVVPFIHVTSTSRATITVTIYSSNGYWDQVRNCNQKVIINVVICEAGPTTNSRSLRAGAVVVAVAWV